MEPKAYLKAYRSSEAFEVRKKLSDRCILHRVKPGDVVEVVDAILKEAMRRPEYYVYLVLECKKCKKEDNVLIPSNEWERYTSGVEASRSLLSLLKEEENMVTHRICGDCSVRRDHSQT